ncbi:hypothetical protein [Spongiactinospora sp. TRM90649]|uniref:hypothetical protein n=1 Tax=Spongiactinospora sp. TRM90649 TaxID=3031114 RepID=UPI0023F7F4DE|nr:hypothetical protein [Spongiactinospora sp. TRM90649]MDF5753012.1 hypothetical protein [Spongiactinospora sp. TRM90649]
MPLLAGAAILLLVFSATLMANGGMTGGGIATNASPEPPPPHTPSPSMTLTGDDQLLSKRITGFGPGRQTVTWLDNCRPERLPESTFATRSVLRCAALPGSPAESALAIMFADRESLDAFIRREAGTLQPGSGEACPIEDKFDYTGDWTNSEGIRIGRIVCRDTGSAYRLVWSFENDAFVDANQVPFVIVVDGDDQRALVDWWKKTPV